MRSECCRENGETFNVVSANSCESLKSIRFAGELLPEWAQLLDVAARLCPVSAASRAWFSRFTRSSGVADGHTIMEHCIALQRGIQEQRPKLAAELARSRLDAQPVQIIGAWLYALDTMKQQAQSHPTCGWIVTGAEDVTNEDIDGGDITLRRV